MPSRRHAPRTMPAEETDITVDELLRLAEHEKVIAIGEAGPGLFLRQGAARTIRPPGSGGTSRRRGRADCHSSSMRATPTTTSPQSWRTRWGRGPFPSSCIAFLPAGPWPKPASGSAAMCPFQAFLTFNEVRGAEGNRPRSAARSAAGGDGRALSGRRCPTGANATNRPLSRTRAHVLAETIGVDDAEIARLTTDNFFSLFTRAKRPGDDA